MLTRSLAADWLAAAPLAPRRKVRRVVCIECPFAAESVRNFRMGFRHLTSIAQRGNDYRYQ
jgi:hypothetical protein